MRTIRTDIHVQFQMDSFQIPNFESLGEKFILVRLYGKAVLDKIYTLGSRGLLLDCDSGRCRCNC